MSERQLFAAREDDHPASPWWVRDNKGAVAASYCTEADAKLFAAAPDLLDGAKAHIAARDALFGTTADKLTADDPRFAAVRDTLDALKAAIAKAEGRA